MEAYKFLSNNFKDSPHNFSENERVVKVELFELDKPETHLPKESGSLR